MRFGESSTVVSDYFLSTNVPNNHPKTAASRMTIAEKRKLMRWYEVDVLRSFGELVWRLFSFLLLTLIEFPSHSI